MVRSDIRLQNSGRRQTAHDGAQSSESDSSTSDFHHNGHTPITEVHELSSKCQGVELCDNDIVDLEVETRDIKAKFNVLFTKVRRTFIRREIAVDDFVHFLKGIPAFIQGKESLFDSTVIASLKKKTLTDIFDVLQDYCSWFNHLLISDIIDAYCEDDENVKKSYEEFCIQLQTYCKHRVCKCSSLTLKKGFMFGRNKNSHITLKYDANWSAIRLEQLHEVKYNLAKILKVQRRALFLESVENGCVQLTFFTPDSIAKQIFPLTSDQERLLSESQVLQLDFEEYSFRSQPVSREVAAKEIPQSTECATLSCMPSLVSRLLEQSYSLPHPLLKSSASLPSTSEQAQVKNSQPIQIAQNELESGNSSSGSERSSTDLAGDLNKLQVGSSDGGKVYYRSYSGCQEAYSKSSHLKARLRRHTVGSVQSPVSGPTTPTPKPRIPRKTPAGLRDPVQETGHSAGTMASYVYKNSSALDVLAKLETDGLFSPMKPEGLIEVAKDVNRKDLATEVEKFIKFRKKSASKKDKRAKNQPQYAESDEADLHLKSNFEVILAQTTVLMQQVDILERAIAAGKEHRCKVKEAIKEARQTAERLAQTLQRAQSQFESGNISDSGSDRSSTDLSPVAEDLQKPFAGSVQPPVSGPASPTPKPRIPRKPVQETASGLGGPVQETGRSAGTMASNVAKVHLPAVRGKPGVQKPVRYARPSRDTSKPQSAPNTPSMDRVISQRTKPVVPPRQLPASTRLTSSVARQQHHTMLRHTDSSNNYADLVPTENEELEDSTGGTGDSGFSEAGQWKRHMQHPPPLPPRHPTSDSPELPEQSHYYKSLNRSEIEVPSYHQVQHQDVLDRLTNQS